MQFSLRVSQTIWETLNEKTAFLDSFIYKN